MSDPVQSPEYTSASEAFFNQFRAHAKVPGMLQRIQAFCFNSKGKMLSDYLSNGSSESEKIALLTELTGILDRKEYEKLPSSPAGQAGPPPASAPAPVKPVAKPAPVKAPAPAPVPEPVAITPEPTPIDAGDEDPDVAAAMLAVARAKAAAKAKAEAAAKAAAVPVAAPGLTADEVRAIVGDELTIVVRHAVDARISELFSVIVAKLKKE